MCSAGCYRRSSRTLLSSRKRAKKEMKKASKMMEEIDDHLMIPYRENNEIRVDELSERGVELVRQFCGDTDGKVGYRMKTVNDQFFTYKVQETMFNSRQLGLKVSANSLYGFLGAQVTGKFSMIEASMCVTSRGRELITDAALFFEKHYGAITVYGDTDSTMVSVPSLNDDASKAWEMGEVMENHINGNDDRNEGIFPPPLYLETEENLPRAVHEEEKVRLHGVRPSRKHRQREELGPR